MSDVIIDITEDQKMDNNINVTLDKEQIPEQPKEAVNRLFFNAREWSFNKDCKDNAGTRSFMQGPDGIVAEGFTIGNWSWNWTEIVSKTLILPKNTLNTFTFWLNGGENDHSDEVCRFEVLFNNDYENRFTYNLNRNFIKPVKRCNGWELYEIPFRTENNEYTQLRFVAQKAFMTVLNAREISAYNDLPESVDRFADKRPQRHNIIFEDGWPTNTWYSTKNLEAQENNQARTQNFTNGAVQRAFEGMRRSFSGPNSVTKNVSFNGVNAQQIIDELGALSSIDTDFLKDEIVSAVKNALNGIDTDNQDTDEIEDIVTDAIQGALVVVDDLTGRIDELTEKLEELTDID